MSNGGFDVVIGNPPWKEYASIRRQYSVLHFSTERCGNLHGICTERALDIRNANGRASFIVQLPLVSSSRMVTVREILRARSESLHVIPFDDRPGKLFDGLEHCRAVVWLSEGPGPTGDGGTLATTRYQRWHTRVRAHLFPSIQFAKIDQRPIYPELFPKYASDVEQAVFHKVSEQSDTTVGAVLANGETDYFDFYQEATQYWVKATYGLPYYAKNGIEGAPPHGRYLYFSSAQEAHSICTLLNSSLFYAYFVAYSDCFHLSQTLVSNFPIVRSLVTDKTLHSLSRGLMRELNRHAERKTINTRDGDEISYAEFYAVKSKALIDEIDDALAIHFQLNSDELEFVKNYDIKFRMGLDVEPQ